MVVVVVHVVLVAAALLLLLRCQRTEIRHGFNQSALIAAHHTPKQHRERIGFNRDEGGVREIVETPERMHTST